MRNVFQSLIFLSVVCILGFGMFQIVRQALNAPSSPESNPVVSLDPRENQTPAPLAEVDRELFGTITYKERIPLPAGAVVSAELLDVTDGNTDSGLAAASTLVKEGDVVPVPFRIVYDETLLDETRLYAIRGSINHEGVKLWSGDLVPVLTHGNPSKDVEVLLYATPESLVVGNE